VRASANKSFFFEEQPTLDPRLVISRERVSDISLNVAAPGCSSWLQLSVDKIWFADMSDS
jgi:hypothetical protein